MCGLAAPRWRRRRPRHTLVFYLGDPDGTLAAKYAATLAALPPGKATASGVAIGHAAAADLEARRAGDGRNAPVATPCATGPLTPGNPATTADRPGRRS
jgi:hypothetical protein